MIGLRMVSGIETFAGAMVALAVYAIGKTFFWPTMLAVVGDRFPRTGAVAMSIMGGIGMMSAGLLGGPGLGYAKDRFTAEHLQTTAPAIYEQYKAPTPSRFLFLEEVHGLDGTKLSAAQTAATQDARAADRRLTASIIGDRETLKADAYIPLVDGGRLPAVVPLLQDDRRVQDRCTSRRRRRAGGSRFRQVGAGSSVVENRKNRAELERAPALSPNSESRTPSPGPTTASSTERS